MQGTLPPLCSPVELPPVPCCVQGPLTGSYMWRPSTSMSPAPVMVGGVGGAQSPASGHPLRVCALPVNVPLSADCVSRLSPLPLRGAAGSFRLWNGSDLKHFRTMTMGTSWLTDCIYMPTVSAAPGVVGW
jgi:hypothetical protein